MHHGETLSSITSLFRDQYPLLVRHKVVTVEMVSRFETVFSFVALIMIRNRESVIDTMAHMKLG